MEAYILDRYKKGAALRRSTLPEPSVGPDDVLIEVHAAGLNPLDLKIRDGAFKAFLPYRPPLILGHDVAGKVIRVGGNVRRFQPGDAVYARPRDGHIGTFATQIAVDQADIAPMPGNVSMEEAASIPLVGLTAWQALNGRAGLKAGQKILIHAGAGGVGTLAIQLAKHLGAHVATTTSTKNIELVKSLGADMVVDYTREKFDSVLSDYDVVLNSLDAATLTASLQVLKPGGKLISLSGPPDPAFAREHRLNGLLTFVMRLLSHSIRSKARARDVRYSFLFMHASGAELEQITTLIEAGHIHPIIDRSFAFDQMNEALSYLATGRAKGKVVVRVR
ncbi:MAG: NADP-dependent oxidoreductase [Rhizomicrobium sp.]